LLSQRQVVAGVPPPYLLGLFEILLQLFQRVLPYRLEHPVTHLAGRGLR
jgi:hypothetical protein